jgi:hypothetical protein
LGELFDGGDKRSCHLGHRLGSGEEFAPMVAKEPGNAALDLQAWLNDVEIQAIEALDGQRHMVLDDLGNAGG